MVSERRIFCFWLRYPFTVGINFEEKYRLMQERDEGHDERYIVILTYRYPVYLPTATAAELAYLILDLIIINT